MTARKILIAVDASPQAEHAFNCKLLLLLLLLLLLHHNNDH